VTPLQAATRLSVSLARVYDYIEDGRLTATKPGRDWNIDPASVEALALVPRRSGRPTDAEIEARLERQRQMTADDTSYKADAGQAEPK
jgi:excisionase family DNA binding protein